LAPNDWNYRNWYDWNWYDWNWYDWNWDHRHRHGGIIMQFIKDNKNIFFLLGVAVVTLGLWAFSNSGIYNSGDEDISALIAELAEESEGENTEEIVVEVSKVKNLAEKANEAAVINQVNESVKASIDTDFSDED
jgi:hypothetical protein